MHNNANTEKHEAFDTLNIPQSFSHDYSELLTYHKLEYKIVDYYLQVGEITKTQGWILHLSIIISQLNRFLTDLLPEIIAERVPFKIGMNKETCRNLLLGHLGKAQVGKVICLYPASDAEALRIAEKLVKLTADYKGPSVLTDICLGNIVYTRYGSFNPVMVPDASGREEKHIYNNKGELVKDSYTIPFQLPKGVTWPFSALASPVAPAPKRILKNVYKPLELLKSDLKGDVLKGLYLKSLFKIIPCVIKQGKKNMISEDSGRDMYDRLLWQHILHIELSNIVPLPQVFDFFQEDDDTYLIMEFIKGESLQAFRKRLIPNYRDWLSLRKEEATVLLDYLITITNIVEKLHQKGYVHRDIAPGNFIIDKIGNIYLIDIELTYSVKDNKPNPPFVFGTPGFMSPEQQLIQTPTYKEDIYGLGALILEMLIGLAPVRLETSDHTLLYDNLYFFIQNEDITRTLFNCLNPDPQIRPSLKEIHDSLSAYRQLFNDATTSYPQKTSVTLVTSELRDTISSALEGLNKIPVVTFDDFWYSRLASNDPLAPLQQLEYTRYIGMREGLSGVLYLLARAKQSGFSIHSSMNGYLKSVEFIENNHLSFLPNVVPGLYDGTAGAALALAEGITSGLLEDTLPNRRRLERCLNVPNTYLDVSKGIAGQGIALLQCASYMDETINKQLLDSIIKTLLQTQEKDGSWKFSDSQQKDKNFLRVSFGQGISGIIWFLLAYTSKYQNSDVQKSIVKALDLIAQHTHDLNDLFEGDIFLRKVLYGTETGDERKGILLTFMKAYEVLGDEYYKKLVEPSLMKYPPRAIRNDYTQESGMAGLGEIYLEAFRIFKNSEWQERANWIANVYIHTFFRQSNESGHWIIDENSSVMTADFMIGLSGIIHFLLRCLDPEKIRYRLVG